MVSDKRVAGRRIQNEEKLKIPVPFNFPHQRNPRLGAQHAIGETQDLVERKATETPISAVFARSCATGQKLLEWF
jgi:hypothetical protein